MLRVVLFPKDWPSTPLKFFYAGPMFRHERPQKGRLRQFHQIGIETVGVARPQADIEIIAAGAAFFRNSDFREGRPFSSIHW